MNKANLLYAIQRARDAGWVHLAKALVELYRRTYGRA